MSAAQSAQGFCTQYKRCDHEWRLWIITPHVDDPEESTTSCLADRNTRPIAAGSILDWRSEHLFSFGNAYAVLVQVRFVRFRIDVKTGVHSWPVGSNATFAFVGS